MNRDEQTSLSKLIPEKNAYDPAYDPICDDPKERINAVNLSLRLVHPVDLSVLKPPHPWGVSAVGGVISRRDNLLCNW